MLKLPGHPLYPTILEFFVSDLVNPTIPEYSGDKNIFFILSPARCRSTWFSNLFTYKDSFCYNEEFLHPRKPLDSWDQIEEKIKKRPEKNIGFGGPELLYYIENLYKIFPNAKYILLERNRDQVEQSLINYEKVHLKAASKAYDRWYACIETFKEIIEHYKYIHWDDMDKLNEIKRIWNYILPNCNFDQQRWKMLNSMRINTIKVGETSSTWNYPIENDSSYR